VSRDGGCPVFQGWTLLGIAFNDLESGCIVEGTELAGMTLLDRKAEACAVTFQMMTIQMAGILQLAETRVIYGTVR